ncbi:FUSC family protein [Dokdonella koreensis]|uniref:Membrane protein n=1 Tax=Dokdonella koreensis DS-123 TaxID=1300342 RepID=A0A167GLF7_9GAMM|nr:FUSC family protein [Dokdonella koreensis]ANB16693.1 Putative membrane protein [Dokdonella koreensis DS-123]
MLRPLLQLKPRDVPYRVALRNTLAVVAPLAIAAATGHTAAGVAMATGALNTMFSDQPGPYRLRMQRMLLTALAAGLSAFAGITLGADTTLLAMAALLWGFGGGLLVALGPEQARTGLTSMILLIVTSDMHRPPEEAAVAAALIFAGGLLQTATAIAAWPLQRYRPERFALATVFRQLAATARQHPGPDQAPPTTQAVQDAVLLLHGQHRARGVAVQAFRVIAEICERIRLELLALCEIHERLAEPQARERLGGVLEHAAWVLDGLAYALEHAESPTAAAAAVATLDPLVAALADTRTNAVDGYLLRIAVARGQGLAGQLRSVVRNSEFAGSRGEIRAEQMEARLPAALQPRGTLATLRANLNLASVACRHALRCGVCLAIAVAFERLLAIPHGFWIPMTAAIVLKPDFASTFSFGVLRVAGTLAGLLLTTAIAHLAMDDMAARLVLLAVFCFGFRLLTTMHYGLGVALLTGLLVILLSFDGLSPADTIVPRGIATVLGCALALAAYALWPTWERLRVRTALAAMIDAYRAYATALLTERDAAMIETRTAARAARTNAQASIDRLRGEPQRDRRELVLAEALLANANRLVRACMSLEAVLQDAPDLPQRDHVLAFAGRADQALAAIADALRRNTPLTLPSLRGEERLLAVELDPGAAGDEATRTAMIAVADTCDRIADSVDTLAYLLRPAAS